jgi:hypothetical protein
MRWNTKEELDYMVNIRKLFHNLHTISGCVTLSVFSIKGIVGQLYEI